ncbi:hypothetical protein [Streptomyces sp. CC224B]|uniref:hypothetical protein n=1 Tax=Streptomyces sp. CC224B TaxID=3044571 RepID=UPI0024A98807|nr:hypothetical protein [Streptomyces sp. CC224B]
MTTIGFPPRSPESWDRPAAEVAAEARRLLEARRHEASVAEQRHLVDPLEGAFARLACEHPETCACDGDYPGWAEQLAARATTNHRPREAS